MMLLLLFNRRCSSLGCLLGWFLQTEQPILCQDLDKTGRLLLGRTRRSGITSRRHHRLPSHRRNRRRYPKNLHHRSA